MDCVTGHNIASTMLETVPEFREVYPYPMTIVMDSFADYVSDRARNGTPEHLLRPYFEFVERLAASDDQELHNLVVVDFLEAAPWELLGVGELLGPATRTLADTTRARRRKPDPPIDLSASIPTPRSCADFPNSARTSG